MNALTVPTSMCGTWCIESTSDRRRGTGRMVAFVGMLCVGLACAPVLAVLRGRARRVALRALARSVLRAIGVRVVVRGRAPRAAALVVANHVSWLDPLVMLAVEPVRPVAKVEVRAWPAVGSLVAATGTIFIDRVRPRTLPRTVGEVASALRAGSSVAAFPEGTTTCGPDQGRFRPALFQAAIDAGAPVVPLAIRYDSPAAAFVGEDTLLASVRRVAATRQLTVTLTIAPALYPDAGADRRTLARAAQSAIGPLTVRRSRPSAPHRDHDLAA